jgi:hypothetical protein
MSDYPTALRALADRIEHEAPSRELDAEIAQAIHPGSEWRPYSTRGRIKWLFASNGRILVYGTDGLERYTSSLDAAATLMPDKLYWLLSKGRTRPDEPIYGAQAFRPGNDVPFGEAETDTSAAAALCSAALRARAAMVGDDADG